MSNTKFDTALLEKENRKTSTKGYAAANPTTPLAPFSFERREPGEHDVVIDIKFCGICHSDIHQTRDEWSEALEESIFPMVPGHEIVGIVTKVGNKVSKYKIGNKVGVGCFVDSCRTCAECKAGLEQYCTVHTVFTYNSREHDGTPTYGGYSEMIVVDENYVLRIPQNLALDGAAPLLCAGITLYSPLRHWNAGPGKKVAIVGMGGLGHMGVKLAHAMGAEVTVLSQSLKKQADGKRLGADHFYATSDPETFTKLKGSFDLIINTVSSDMDWNEYLGLLKVDGTMVIVGIPEKKIAIGAFSLVAGRRSLAGSSIGGIRETQEMLDFCGEHNLTADIELVPIQKVNEAYERVQKSDVRYRFVIDMASLKSST
jgi:alcohol dehydrogenase (NADP+)